MSNTPAEQPADVITSAGPGSLKEAAERRKRLAELEVRKRELNAELRQVGSEIADVEQEVIDDFTELGTDQQRVTVGGVIYTQTLGPDLSAGPLQTGIDDKSGDPKSTDEDWQRAVAAVRSAGAAHLVQERFNAQSFKSWLSDFRDTHGPGWQEHLPPSLDGTVRIHERMKVRMRKVGRAR